MPERVAIIVALAREAAPLARQWQAVSLNGFAAWRREEVLLARAGIGAVPARRAAEAAIAFHRPDLLISAGFAGSLHDQLGVAALVIPGRVLDAASGRSFPTDIASEQVLLTVDSIAGSLSKQELARRYKAHAVDMEAASVAEVAQSRGIRFRAMKAISEELDFPMPPLQAFVGEHGNFRTAAFLAYMGLRPWRWPAMWDLKRNTDRAGAMLARSLQCLQVTAGQEVGAERKG